MGPNPKKEDELKCRMEKLGIKEEDLVEKFIFGSGSGGQKLNKTASCVYLKHIPTGIEVKCQKERSQQLNRFFARRELCDQIAAKVYQEKTATEKKQEKVRNQKNRRARRLKKKRQAQIEER
ncbi:MAG: peptide chain release factor-like protein [Chlamydiota bacterium]